MGILGDGTHSTAMDAGTLNLGQSHPPGPRCAGSPSEASSLQAATQLARELLQAVGDFRTRDAVGRFLGQQSFTAGVVAGAGKSVVLGVAELARLLKVLALAEYYQTRHAATFWERMQRAVTLAGPLSGLFMAGALASHFWSDFDREAEQAWRDREALIKAVAYAFEHPGEVFENVKQESVDKYQRFKALRAQGTLAGEFEAGMLFGELLIDVLLVIDGVTAAARLATKVPELLKLLPDLKALAPKLRGAVKTGTAATEDAARSAGALERPTPSTGVRPKEASASTAAPVGPKPPPPKKAPSFKPGASDGGPGAWGENAKGYPKKPTDAAFQQSVTGAPQGIEYRVPTDKMKSGEKWFDGYDPESGHLIDAKNYKDWPKEELAFSMKKEEAMLKLNDSIAGSTGTKVEYHVATSEKAALLQDIADDAGLRNTIIKVVGGK